MCDPLGLGRLISMSFGMVKLGVSLLRYVFCEEDDWEDYDIFYDYGK